MTRKAWYGLGLLLGGIGNIVMMAGWVAGYDDAVVVAFLLMNGAWLAGTIQRPEAARIPESEVPD